MRKKEREAIIHKPSVHEVFYCLCDMPSWSEILLSKETNKPYKRFLLWLIESKFKTQRNEKLSVKALASDFGISSAKATQWLFSIYEDILSLNQV